jgi:enolase
MNITQVKALEILDSRGNPTVEAMVEVEGGLKAYAAVPSGASTGSHEAHELRDGDETRFGGKGVLQAVDNVNSVIADSVIGMEVTDQEKIDQTMIELDGTEHKTKLGANAILAVSMAATKAASLSEGMKTYEYVARLFGNNHDNYILPVPMMNLLNGGKHAMGASDIQEYMIMPLGASSVTDAIRWGAEVFHTLGKMLKSQGFQTTVGDEGGYAPSLKSNEAPLKLLVEAISKAGYKPGEEIAIAMDPAASEFYSDGIYNLKADGETKNSGELVSLYQEWINKYPIRSIEDCHAEDDWDGFVKMTDAVGKSVQIVGDDLFVTNPERLQKGIDLGAGNAILIKLNQIGTVSETIKTMKLAKEAGMNSVVSHRSGETEDAFIADFVVGAGSGQIKTGSLSRSDRVAKYNQLLRIEAELDGNAVYSKMD